MVIDSCNFSYSYAMDGGAIYLMHGSNKISNCYFFQDAGLDAFNGAVITLIANDTNDNTIIDHCTFLNTDSRVMNIWGISDITQASLT